VLQGKVPSLHGFFFFFVGAHLNAWKGGRECTQAHHCHLLFCYNVTTQRGWQHKNIPMLFFLLQLSTKCKEKEVDDNDMLSCCCHCLLFCCSVDAQKKWRCVSGFTLLFFLLQFSIKHKEEEEDDALNHVIIIYCFVVSQLCKEDNNVKVYRRHWFFLGYNSSKSTKRIRTTHSNTSSSSIVLLQYNYSKKIMMWKHSRVVFFCCNTP
jgi:hypothetical protein